jgi:hypothetical protein
VVAADHERAPHQLAEAGAGVGAAQLEHQRGLRHGDVVEHAETAEDDPCQQQAAERQAADREAGVERVLAGEARERGDADEGGGQRRRQAQRQRGADGGRGGLAAGTVRQVQRHEHDRHGADQGDRHRAAPAQDGRDHEADDHRERQREAQQRADPLPAAERHHRRHEQRHQQQHRPGPLEVADVVVGRLAGLLEHGELDALAGPEGAAGRVGGLELDLPAAVQPRGDLDAGRPGRSRLGLLARRGLDAGQGGALQPGRVGLVVLRPGQRATRPQRHRADDHRQHQHPDHREHRPVAANRHVHALTLCRMAPATPTVADVLRRAYSCNRYIDATRSQLSRSRRATCTFRTAS